MRCPGQDTRYWKEDAIFEIQCPNCGTAVEFFKDDTTRQCSNCKKILVNPEMDFGCALYCQYADICLGELPKELLQDRSTLIKERIALEVEKRIPKELFKEIKRVCQALKNSAKERGISLGLSLLLLYFYYLTPDERKKVAQKVQLPKSIFKEIELKLKDLKEKLSPEELLKTLNSK
uniref:Phosphohydrolase n=1 Tax=Thermodesulfobacterium geofontis TaxID=1295609 RepID=A0A7C4NSM9_9BACT